MTNDDDDDFDVRSSLGQIFSEEEVPEDLVRAKAKWDIEKEQRKLRLLEDKVRKQLDQLSTMTGLPKDVVRMKITNDISLADRRMKLDELKAEHDMLLEAKIEEFRQKEILRLNELLVGTEEHWFRKYWRAAAGWTYLLICVFDFVIAPVFFALLPVWTNAQHQPWTSLTTSNGGLMHISFGAILGVAAWTRGQNDLAKAKMVTTKMNEDNI